MRNYIHTRTCVYNINYHLVWCVKYRKKVLTQTICDRLYDILYQIADEKSFTIIECKAGGQDHVHCFVSAPPTFSVTQIVKFLKGISASILFKEYPELRIISGRESYGAGPISVRRSDQPLRRTSSNTSGGRRIVSYKQSL